MAGFRAWFSKLFGASPHEPSNNRKRIPEDSRIRSTRQMDSLAQSAVSAMPYSRTTRPQLIRQSQRLSFGQNRANSITAIEEDEEPPEYELSPLTRVMASPYQELPPNNLHDTSIATPRKRPPLNRNFSRRFSNRFSVASDTSVDSNEAKRFSQISSISSNSARSSRSGRWSERMGSLTPLSVA